jgi:hypothetical protein
MKISLRKKIFSFVSFAFTVIILVLVLKLVNWLPLSFEKGEMRKYKTVDDIRTELRLSQIYTPTYFPENIKWPPSEIFAQRRPFVMIMMHFTHSDTRNLALSIYQVDADAHFDPSKDREILYVKKEIPVLIKNTEGSLVMAVCRPKDICNRLSWEAGPYRVTLISDYKPERLIKIAESMR